MTKDQQTRIDLFETVLNSLEKKLPALDRSIKNKESCSKILRSLLATAEDLSENKLITFDQFRNYYNRIAKITNVIDKF